MILTPSIIDDAYTTESKEDVVDTSIDYSVYGKLLMKNTPSIRDATDAEKQQYLTSISQLISNQTGYEKQMFNKLAELAEATNNLNNAKITGDDANLITELEQIESLKLFELEDLGVTTVDRYNANPDYWIQKAIKAKTNIESDETISLIGEYNESDIHYVHTGYTSLKRTSVLTFPCWDDYGIQASCPMIGWGWNEGKSTSEIWFIPTDGSVSFRSSVCNEGNYHHNKIKFDYGVKRDIHYLGGNELYKYNEVFDTKLDKSKGSCSDKIKDKIVKAGSRAGMTTSINNISYEQSQKAFLF